MACDESGSEYCQDEVFSRDVFFKAYDDMNANFAQFVGRAVVRDDLDLVHATECGFERGVICATTVPRFRVLFAIPGSDFIEFFSLNYYSFTTVDHSRRQYQIATHTPAHSKQSGSFGGPAGIRTPDQGIMSTQDGSDRL